MVSKRAPDVGMLKEPRSLGHKERCADVITEASISGNAALRRSCFKIQLLLAVRS
jgi:hypothetical protein